MTQLRKEMDQREQDYAAFLAESQPLSIRHFQQFGEVLDLRKLMQHPEIGKVGLKGALTSCSPINCGPKRMRLRQPK